MTLLIIPIVIRVSAGALSKGAGVAIGRWAGGSVAKKYIATAVTKKAIEEGRKMAMGESGRWQSAFRDDPAEAMRDAAAEFVNQEARDIIGQKSEISRELVTEYRRELLRQVGQEVVRRAERQNPATSDGVFEFNRDAVVDRTTEAIISRGLALSNPSNRESVPMPLDEALNGESEGIDKGRSLASYAENPTDAEEIIRTSARRAYEETLDESALRYTVVGPDDLFQAKVRSPLEAILEKAMDVDEPASL